ncbi:hypothetical protein SU86_09670 [Candidatus Nitrosotenuis cloacae]|uniref:Uncharacterized protein n=1 Tax=Candidatus Nitrosotenuis cloacae TaxID=1603555 RepID=A0A3G1BU90_9ARCH|nr:hypothetical protein SU86_09670 [Candidatus Nitrosotenuis cloacae]
MRDSNQNKCKKDKVQSMHHANPNSSKKDISKNMFKILHRTSFCQYNPRSIESNPQTTATQ